MSYLRGMMTGVALPFVVWGLTAVACNLIVFHHPDPYIRVAAANLYALLTAWAW